MQKTMESNTNTNNTNNNSNNNNINNNNDNNKMYGEVFLPNWFLTWSIKNVEINCW